MVRDTRTGELRWSGHYQINPWDDEGRLVDLDAYPRLAAYFARHNELLRRRHVGRRQPQRWYRTIDKVDAGLTAKSKLLMPCVRTSGNERDKFPNVKGSGSVYAEVSNHTFSRSCAGPVSLPLCPTLTGRL